MTYTDKIWHFLIWFMIGAWLTLWLGWIAGLITGIAIGVLKEWWDKYRGGKFDLYDLGADILGTVLGVWLVIRFE